MKQNSLKTEFIKLYELIIDQSINISISFN